MKIKTNTDIQGYQAYAIINIHYSNHDLFSSPNIIRVIVKKNEVGGACNTDEGGRGAYRILVGRPEGRNHFEDPGIDGRIILKWIFKKWDGWAWGGLLWLRIGTGGWLL
jgi:hypothetical protein